MKLKVHVLPKETWQGMKTQASPFISQGDLHPLIHINSAPLNFWGTKQQTPCLFSPADSHSTLPGVVQASQTSLAFDSAVEEEIKRFILIIAPELKISEVKSNIQAKYSKLYPHAQ